MSSKGKAVKAVLQADIHQCIALGNFYESEDTLRLIKSYGVVIQPVTRLLVILEWDRTKSPDKQKATIQALKNAAPKYWKLDYVHGGKITHLEWLIPHK